MDRYIEALKKSKAQKAKQDAKRNKRAVIQAKRIKKQVINEGKPQTSRILHPYATILQKRETINPNITHGDVANIIKEGQKAGKNYDDILREIEARKKLSDMFNVQRSAHRLQLGEKPKVEEKKYTVKQMDDLLAKLDTIATRGVDSTKESTEPQRSKEPQDKKIYSVKGNAHMNTYMKFFKSMETFETFKNYVESKSGRPFKDFVEWVRTQNLSIVNDLEKKRLIFNAEGKEYDFGIVFDSYLMVKLDFDPSTESPRRHQYPESPQPESIAKQLFHQSSLAPAPPAPALAPAAAATPAAAITKKKNPQAPAPAPAAAPATPTTPAQTVNREDPAENDTTGYARTPNSSHSKTGINKLLGTYFATYPSNGFKKNKIPINVLVKYLVENNMEVMEIERNGQFSVSFGDKYGNIFNIGEMITHMKQNPQVAPTTPAQETGKGFHIRLMKAHGIKAGLNALKAKHGKKMHDKVKRKLMNDMKAGTLIL